MYLIYLTTILLSLLICTESFRKSVQRLHPSKIIRLPPLRSHQFLSNTFSVTVGDYAAEIEKATGTEIYGPIMQAGVFLFISGFISAFIAAFIISKSNSWEGLAEEFEAGKQAQLDEFEKKSENTKLDLSAAAYGGENEMKQLQVEVGTTSEDIKGLDL